MGSGRTVNHDVRTEIHIYDRSVCRGDMLGIRNVYKRLGGIADHALQSAKIDIIVVDIGVAAVVDAVLCAADFLSVGISVNQISDNRVAAAEIERNIIRIIGTVINKAAISTGVAHVAADHGRIVRSRAVREAGDLVCKSSIAADQDTAHLVAADVGIALSHAAGITGSDIRNTLRHTLIRSVAKCDDVVSAVQQLFKTVEIKPVVVLTKIDNIRDIPGTFPVSDLTLRISARGGRIIILRNARIAVDRMCLYGTADIDGISEVGGIVHSRSCRNCVQSGGHIVLVSADLFVFDRCVLMITGLSEPAFDRDFIGGSTARHRLDLSKAPACRTG